MFTHVKNLAATNVCSTIFQALGVIGLITDVRKSFNPLMDTIPKWLHTL